MKEFEVGKFYTDGVRTLVYVGEAILSIFHETDYDEDTGSLFETDEVVYLTHREASRFHLA